MSTDVLSLSTFLGNHDLTELQQYATKLLSSVEPVPLEMDEEKADDEQKDIFQLRKYFIEIYGVVQPWISNNESKTGSQMHTTSNYMNEREHKSSGNQIKSFTLTERERDLFMNCLVQIDQNHWIDSKSRFVSQMAKISVMYITVCILLQISKALIDSTLNSLNDINYYDRVLSRKYSIVLYFIQTLPQNTYDFLYDVNVKLINSNVSSSIVEIPTWMPRYTRATYINVWKYVKLAYRLINKSIEEFVRSPSMFLMEKQKDSTSLFKIFWNSTFRLPYYYSKIQIERKRCAILDLQKSNVAKLGYLLTNIPSYDILDGEKLDMNVSILKYLSSVLNKEEYEFKKSEKIEVDSLIKLINTDFPDFLKATRSVEKRNSTPSYLERNWPLIVPALFVAVLYVPSTLRNFHLLLTDAKLREEFYDYLKGAGKYILDTSVAFWNNWVLNPINNILKTIRHDDNSKIALMSQQSLGSDLDSLERMVVDYAKDSDLPLNYEEIEKSVRSGDLTLIMNDYEKDLKSPIKSILLGDMLRNIMIQIQKTKVDGSLALNGVDQILKSQELVFGFVAASPSLFIVWMMKNSFMSWYNGESFNSTKMLHKLEVKGRMCKSLGNIEKLIDYMVIQQRQLADHNDDHSGARSVDYFKTGLVFIEIKNLKKLACMMLPLYVFNNFGGDVDELIDPGLDVEYKLLAIQRIWNVYGGYFY